MPTLNLTWSTANRCWVKSLGYWFNEANQRVPRYFRFAHPNTPEGLRAAQTELVPLLADWQKIKAAAKAKGVEPVWYRPTLRAPSTTANPHSVKSVETQAVLTANADANPDKPLDATSVSKAHSAFIAWIKSTGVKTGTLGALDSSLKNALKGFDLEQPMKALDVPAVIDAIIVRTAGGGQLQ